MDKFHLRIHEIEDLTDKQIVEVYFHKRDENGSLIMPRPEQAEPKESYESEMMALHQIKAICGDNVQGWDEAVAKLKKKYGKEGN